MTVFAIEYHYPADSSQIIELRPAHREFLGKLKEEGKLIGSGPYTDGDGDALIVIQLDDSATIADAEALWRAIRFTPIMHSPDGYFTPGTRY